MSVHVSVCPFVQALMCLVQLASIRRSLFSVAERSTFLQQLIKGVNAILQHHPAVRAWRVGVSTVYEYHYVTAHYVTLLYVGTHCGHHLLPRVLSTSHSTQVKLPAGGAGPVGGVLHLHPACRSVHRVQPTVVAVLC